MIKDNYKKEVTSKERTKITKCPKCGSRRFIISIFGSICPECFYEEVIINKEKDWSDIIYPYP